jgi:hypothetical protein
MAQLSHAVETFSDDVSAMFDFTDTSPHQQTNNFLVKFYKCVQHYCKSSKLHTPDYAAQLLSERLIDWFHHKLLRANIPPTLLPNMLQEQLLKLDSDIHPWLPCTATKKFDGIDKPVRCESILSEHGEVHQSSQTYPTNILKGEFAKLFGSNTACRWSGSMETSMRFVELKLQNIVPCTATEFVENHKKILEAQRHILLTLQAYRINSGCCLACLQDFCTEVLECGHVLCVTCCDEFLSGGIIECPFCGCKGKWKREDIPLGAGVRALKIQGELKQGVASAVLLQQIEERLGIEIYHLFDLIISTGTGTLSALGYGLLHMNGTRVVELFNKASKVMVQAKADLPSDPELKVVVKRVLAHFNRISSALEGLVPDKRLFVGSQMPRVAVQLPWSEYSYNTGLGEYLNSPMLRVASFACIAFVGDFYNLSRSRFIEVQL